MSSDTYRAVKNLIVNDLGFSREYVAEVVRKHAADYVRAWLEHNKESTWLRAIIRQAAHDNLRQEIRDAVKNLKIEVSGIEQVHASFSASSTR